MLLTSSWPEYQDPSDWVQLRSTHISVVVLIALISAGLNGDCAVNFVNGVEQARVFQGTVFVEFSRIGPVTFTDCRLDNNEFVPCE